ncbi:hypothetical protein AB0L06_25590 [Spirillospora sp. NPDC052269]
MAGRGGADAVARIVAAYAPAGDPPGWRRVSGPVRTAVLQAAPALSYPPGELLGVLAKLALFADAEGHPAQVHLWLTREFIERFVMVGCAELGQATRGTYRSKLLRLREALLGGDCRTGPAARLSAAAAQRPYTPAEQAALWSAATGQPTDELRHGLITLLALGLGCGLDAREITLLHAADIRPPAPHTVNQHQEQNGAHMKSAHQDGRGSVVVGVRGRRARMVVCRRPWEHVLTGRLTRLHATRSATGGHLFRPTATARGGNLITNFTARAHWQPGVPPLKTSRLRATWLVTLIDDGVPLDVIVAAAGLETLHSLTRLLPHARPTAPADAALLLRGRP